MANACDTICSSIINSNDVKLCIMRKKICKKQSKDKYKQSYLTME